MTDELRFESGDALIIVDVQNDFCPGGALAIEDGDAVVPVLNRLVAQAVEQGVPVYASRCWHPRGHISFEESGGQWPPHCLQGSEGAAFHPALSLPDDAVIVTKGVRFDQDQNSAFDQTGLADELRRRGIARVWVGGLAEDVCVLATVLDARTGGLEVVVVCDGMRPVTAAGGEDARSRMRNAGAKFVADDSVARPLSAPRLSRHGCRVKTGTRAKAL